jgi:hypothetical protein
VGIAGGSGANGRSCMEAVVVGCHRVSGGWPILLLGEHALLDLKIVISS